MGLWTAGVLQSHLHYIKVSPCINKRDMLLTLWEKHTADFMLCKETDPRFPVLCNPVHVTVHVFICCLNNSYVCYHLWNYIRLVYMALNNILWFLFFQGLIPSLASSSELARWNDSSSGTMAFYFPPLRVFTWVRLHYWSFSLFWQTLFFVAL